jgi:hypothetical protein
MNELLKIAEAQFWHYIYIGSPYKYEEYKETLNKIFNNLDITPFFKLGLKFSTNPHIPPLLIMRLCGGIIKNDMTNFSIQNFDFTDGDIEISSDTYILFNVNGDILILDPFVVETYFFKYSGE